MQVIVIDASNPLDSLPSYIYCDDPDCSRHYLSVNKDIQGRWVGGYIEYKNHSAFIFTDPCDTLDELAESLTRALNQ